MKKIFPRTFGNTLKVAVMVSLAVSTLSVSMVRAEEWSPMDTKGDIRSAYLSKTLPKISSYTPSKKRSWGTVKLAGKTPSSSSKATNSVPVLPKDPEPMAKQPAASSSPLATAAEAAAPIGAGLYIGWKTYDSIKKREENATDGVSDVFEETESQPALDETATVRNPSPMPAEPVTTPAPAEQPKPTAAKQIVPIKRKVIDQQRTLEEETYTYPVQVVSQEYETVSQKVLEAHVEITNVPKVITEWVNKLVPQVKRVAKIVWDTVTDWVKQLVWQSFPVVRQIAETVWQTVVEWVPKTVWSWLGWFWSLVTQWVPQYVQKAVTVYKTVTEMAWRQVEQWIPVVHQVARTVYEDVTEWVTVTEPVVKTVYEQVAQTVYQWVEKPVQVVKQVVKTVWMTGTRLVEKWTPVEREITEYVELN